MKKVEFLIIFSSILMLSQWTISAQTSLTSHAIDENFNSPAGIFSADIDGDGDSDVVAGSSVNGIKLWINMGGNPTQWSTQMIDNNSGVCMSVSIADIVRDGNPDIVAISTDRNQIYYYKNEGGDPIIWSKSLVGSIIDPHEVLVYDIDSDGNQDVFAAGMSDTGEISWWKNNGGDPVQWTKQVISSNAPGARSVSVGDIDGDGDMDVAGAIFAVNEVCWYKNNGGTPINWEKQLVTNSFDGSHRIQCVDMDNDGVLDLLGTGYMAATIAFWSNDDGKGTTWSKHTVDNDFGGAVIGVAADINSDGFMDVFGTAQGTHSVAWYENKGTAGPGFKKRDLGELGGAWPAYVSDIDGDMDIDLIAGGHDANEIRWYENKQLGRFTNNIRINDTPTNIGFFVPEEYTPEDKYKLIVALHICGDENEYSRYRDNLIPLCLELNTIVVAPDCHNSTSDYDIPDPELILDVIEYASSRFNIDEEYVYLTGGSCNGITALKYGLEEIYDFKGIIPFNPWVPDWDEGYYDVQSDMPVCFAAGSQDENYEAAQEIYQQIEDNNGRAGFITMPGIGHQFYFEEVTEYMIECINCIDSLAANNTSANILEHKSEKIKVFPNPFKENLIIQMPESFTGQLEIMMYNLIGQEVYQRKINNVENYNSSIQLSFSDQEIPEGQLMLKIINQDKSFNKKLIRR